MQPTLPARPRRLRDDLLGRDIAGVTSKHHCNDTNGSADAVPRMSKDL